MLAVFLQHLQSEKRYSAHTIRAYKSDIEQLMSDMSITESEINSLTHKQLRVWCSNLIEQGLNTRSVNRKISSVSAFFSYLVRQHIVAQNPTDKVTNPKNSKRLPFFYEEKDMKDLLDIETECEDYVAQRNHAIIELFYGTGMRLSELIGLRLCDVNYSRQIIKVLGKGNKERIIPLNPHLTKEIALYMGAYKRYFEVHPENPLFLPLIP